MKLEKKTKAQLIEHIERLRKNKQGMVRKIDELRGKRRDDARTMATLKWKNSRCESLLKYTETAYADVCERMNVAQRMIAGLLGIVGSTVSICPRCGTVENLDDGAGNSRELLCESCQFVVEHGDEVQCGVIQTTIDGDMAKAVWRWIGPRGAGDDSG